MKQEDKEQLLNDLWKQYHKVCEDCGSGNGCDDCRDCPSVIKKDEIRKKIEELKTNYKTDMENIIEIPEGYEAKIDGNKVILEPKVSEDERIRKAIRSLVLSVEPERLSILKITQSDCLAWLEKQGEKNERTKHPDMVANLKEYLANTPKEQLEKDWDELKHWNNIGPTVEEFLYGKQNPTDKVEPKFKVGDWLVCCDYEPLQIIGIRTNVYEMSNGDIRPFHMIDNNHNIRLWTIQDAKDGDVLVASDNSIFILKSVVNNDCVCYVALSTDNSITLEDYWEVATAVHPATKEQHDLLFQKMREEGYEWDAEKKELKKIKQIKAISMAGKKELTDEEYCGLCMDINCYGCPYVDKSKKKDNIEQNPAWSEEDERRYTRACVFIKNTTLQNVDDVKADLISWFKALKERYTWKPSDKQMETLQFAHNRIVIMHDSHAENDASIIRSLIDDLKKLKG